VITYARATSPNEEIAGPFRAAGLPARVFANSSLASIMRMVLDGIGVGGIAAIGVELQSGALRLLPGLPSLAPLSFTANHADTPGATLATAVCTLAQEVAVDEC